MAQLENTLKNELKTDKKPSPRPSPKGEEEKGEAGKAKFDYTKLRKIAGLLLISFSIFLLFSFLSFLFSWQVDQDLVKSLSWEQIRNANPQMTKNWMGLFGAWLSHLFIFKGFGLAAFFIVPLTFFTGVKLLFNTRHISLLKIFSQSIIGILFFCVLFGYVAGQFSWLIGEKLSYIGGWVGFFLQQWLGGLIGSFGVAIVLTIALLSYLVVVFNINFKLPEFKKKEAAEKQNGQAEGMAAEAPILSEEGPEEMETDVDGIQLIVKPDKESLQAELKVKPAPSEVSFEVKTPEKKAVIEEEPEEIAPPKGSLYKFPTLDILRNHEIANATVSNEELEGRKNLIVETLKNYKIGIEKIEATIGPSVTLYEIIPEAGVRISKIKNLEDDIALSLSALGIRIIAPMPGKGTIGIEVPNQHPQIVSLKQALASQEFQKSTADLPIALGKTISNEVFVADLTKMPHLLMAGATGQGKSVGINTIIASILYKKHPADVKFVLVDPKKVELSLYKNIEKHFLPELPDGQEAIITDTKKVVNVLKSLCEEMDNRYDKMKDAQVRNLKEYNKKIERGLLNQEEHHRLPYIVLIIDELADLMMTAGKEVELPIARLAQLARAIGIHLILATQRPSVNIITGIIKANFPVRVAFRVSSKIDARTILDTGGAEQLIGRGDMLYSNGNDMIRLQCPFIDTEEVEKLTSFISGQVRPEPFKLHIISDEESGGGKEFSADDIDPMFGEAARLVVRMQQGSTSMLQRKLELGYNRAGRLMDQLEQAGIVGPNNGSKAREVLYSDESSLEQFLKDFQSK